MGMKVVFLGTAREAFAIKRMPRDCVLISQRGDDRRLMGYEGDMIIHVGYTWGFCMNNVDRSDIMDMIRLRAAQSEAAGYSVEWR